MCNTSQQVWHTSEVALGLTEGLDMKGAGFLSTEALGVPGFTGRRTVNVEPLPTNQVICRRCYVDSGDADHRTMQGIDTSGVLNCLINTSSPKNKVLYRCSDQSRCQDCI